MDSWQHLAAAILIKALEDAMNGDRYAAGWLASDIANETFNFAVDADISPWLWQERVRKMWSKRDTVARGLFRYQGKRQ